MQNFSISIKDVIYIIGIASSFLSVYYALKHRVANLERECKRLQKIIMDEKGCHHFISTEICKKNRDQVYTTIRRGDVLVDSIISEMKMLNENVIRIMVKLEIDKKP